jgi:serine/threonine-protein kinase RsbW
MDDRRWFWHFERVLPNDTRAGRQVVEQVLARLRRHEWSEHDIFAVHLATEEALVNAVRHGNGGDPTKQVGFVCRLADDRVRIEISNQGPGFDPEGIPDPTRPDRLLMPGGRGLALIRGFMSTVEYHDHGRRVVLERVRQNEASK